MPLEPGKSKETISKNISEFHTGQTFAHTAEKFGKARANAQAVAVALNSARKSGAKIGVPKAKSKKIGVRKQGAEGSAQEERTESAAEAKREGD